MGADMDVIAIIPARGGSKSIPSKNLMDFCGKPLLAWSVLQAKDARSISEVYVSSDSPEILETGERYGALPIVRPSELATDGATSESALRHALDAIALRKDKDPDLVVFLQATSPLREPEDIDRAVETLLAEKADSLFTGAVLDDFCVWQRNGGKLHGLTFDPANRGRRQDRDPLYLENGSIYVFRPEVLRRENNRLGGEIRFQEMAYWKSVEIDRHDDVELATYYFRKYLLKSSSDRSGGTISISDVDLIVYDFDGVMTDNRVLVTEDGSEAILANRTDGLGVEMIRETGVRQLILSMETNPVVRARAGKLGLEVIHGCRAKREALTEFCREHGIELSRVAYVGNDVNDLEAMSIVGFAIAPADAHPEIAAVAQYATRAKGGDGVIREIAERFLTRPAD